MVYAKRLIIAVILGMIFGLVCAYASKSSLPVEDRSMIMCMIALNRTFIGFMIGISCWRMHWVLHGIIIGLLGTLPIAASMFGDPAKVTGAILFLVAGIVWGFLIELLTTVVFRAPMRAIPKEAPAAPPPAEPAPAE